MFDFKNINIRLIAINTILLIAGFFLSDPFHLFEASYEKSPLLLKAGLKSDVTGIKIFNNSAPAIELIKSESGWSIKTADQKLDFPADNVKIEAAIDRLLEMHKYYEVTSTPEKYKEFEVDESGLQIELKSRSKVFNFYIGKQGSSYNTSLIRLKNDKTVYSVRGNLKSDWNQSPDFFRIKQLFHLTKDNIKEVAVSGSANFNIKATEKNSWEVQQGISTIESNQVKVNRLIDDITLLEGTEFYYLPANGFPYGKIKITLKSNTEFNLEVNRIGNEYIAKSEQNPYWQKIPEFRIKSIFPNVNEIKLNSKP
ncbi:MAG: DUF4340 domain-containing protein [Spirochaetia bacterium]|nr:DUF4340 domain-containing protein [Spirochaetia bacterium]